MSDEEADLIPTVEVYRGVGLHFEQSEKRLVVVRAAIDQVFATKDPKELTEIARSQTWPPEARLLAAAVLEAQMQIAADERAVRPKIDLTYVRACVAGVNSLKWRHPTHYATLFDQSRIPGKQDAAPREQFVNGA